MSDIVEKLRDIAQRNAWLALCSDAADEIERLRNPEPCWWVHVASMNDILQDLKNAENAMRWEGIGRAINEIERLRGLLRECCASLGWQGHNEQCLDPNYNDYDPNCPECLLLKRVREALGDE